MNRWVLFFSLGTIVVAITNAARMVAVDSPLPKPDTLDFATPVILMVMACVNWEAPK